MSHRSRANRPTRKAVKASSMPFSRQTFLRPRSTSLTRGGFFSLLALASGWSQPDVTSAHARAASAPIVASRNLEPGMSLSNTLSTFCGPILDATTLAMEDSRQLIALNVQVH